jgi:glycosyltransferase involved in cell wall biosynthesis
MVRRQPKGRPMTVNVNEPLVSVLVTVYNREKYLAESLQSILNSTYRNIEIVVVDDGSKDRSVEIANEFAASDLRIKVSVNARNLGDYRNRNRAAELAIGKYLKYVDSDDRVESNCIATMIDAVKRYPDASYVLSYPRPENTERPLYLSSQQAYEQHLVKNQGFFSSGPLLSLIRTDCFREVGGFRPSARNMGDTILWMELSRRWPMVIVDDGLTFWREHDEQEYNLVRGGGWDNSMTHSLLSHVTLRDFLASDCPLGQLDRKRVRRKLHSDNIRRVFWQLKNLRLNFAAYEAWWTLRSLSGLYSPCVPINSFGRQ